MKRIFTIVFLLGCLSGFSQFEISGIIRPRFEYRDGYKTLRDSSTTFASFVSQRTRLTSKYKKDNLKTEITFYDYRIWGDQKWKADKPSTGIFEAWAEIDANSKLMFKFGRQSFSYDNGRLLSPVNWNQKGAAHDALLIKYRKSGWVADMAFAYNQDAENTFGRDYSSTNNYKALSFLWVNKKFGKFDLATLDILDGFQKQGTTSVDYFRITSGIIAKYMNNDLEIQLRTFDQRGKNKEGKNISAFYGKLDLIYKINKKLTLNLGTEVHSGNDFLDTLNKSDNAFDIVLGGMHSFNGRMDYYNIPSTTKYAGLINPYLSTKISFNDKTSLLCDYHYFMLQNNYVYENKTVEKFLGQEIDFTLTKKISEEITFQAGFSVMFATKTAEIIKGGDGSLFNNWAFVMLTVNPKFFNSSEN